MDTPLEAEEDQATRDHCQLEEALMEDIIMERKEMIPGKLEFMT